MGRGTTEGGGGVEGAGLAVSRTNRGFRASYPSTMLRMVPLPIFDGEAN